MAKSQFSPWANERRPFDCCSKCEPPKRRPGCGSTCKEYKAEKAEYKRQMHEYEKKLPPLLTNYDFDKIGQAMGNKR